MYKKFINLFNKHSKYFIVLLLILIIVVLVIRLLYKSVKIEEMSNEENQELDKTSLSAFTVYESKWPKIRIGRDYDGGYAIADIGNPYDYFLSGGIENDTSFEEDFLKRYPNIECSAFDGTVEPPGITNTEPRFKFVKKNLGATNDDKLSNVREYLDKYNHIFLKLDIEGGEIPLFSSFSDDDLQKFEQIVIEFHDPCNLDILHRLQRTHWLIHFHANNNCGTSTHYGRQVPNVFECTYVLKRHSDNLELNKKPIPDISIDMPNINHRPEIILEGYPFVH